VFTSALFLREEIDLGWVFLGKPNLENDLSWHERQKKMYTLANRIFGLPSPSVVLQVRLC
jgi:hypothetical protein